MPLRELEFGPPGPVTVVHVVETIEEPGKYAGCSHVDAGRPKRSHSRRSQPWGAPSTASEERVAERPSPFAASTLEGRATRSSLAAGVFLIVRVRTKRGLTEGQDARFSFSYGTTRLSPPSSKRTTAAPPRR
jgi:hypothetical protein